MALSKELSQSIKKVKGYQQIIDRINRSCPKDCTTCNHFDLATLEKPHVTYYAFFCKYADARNIKPYHNSVAAMQPELLEAARRELESEQAEVDYLRSKQQ